MKRILITIFAMTLVLSGCSKKDEATPVAKSDNQEKVQISPDAASLLAEHRQKWSEQIKTAWADWQVGDQTNNQINLNGDFFVPAERGGGAVAVKFDGRLQDDSGKTAQSELNGLLSLKAQDSEGKPTSNLQADFSLRTLSSGIYLLLKSANLTTGDNDLTPSLQEHLNKWYGQEFKKEQAVSVTKIFGRRAKVGHITNEIAEIIAEYNFFIVQKALPVEADYYVYQAQLNKTSIEAAYQRLATVLGTSNAQINTSLTNLKQNLEQLNTNGTLRISRTDSRYLTYTGTATGAKNSSQITLNILPTAKQISLLRDGKELSVSFTHQNDITSFTLKENDTNSIFGLYGANKFALTSDQIQINLNRPSDSWRGEITVGDKQDEVLIEIQKLVLNSTLLDLMAEISRSGVTTFTGSLRVATEAVSNVNVEKPDQVTPFLELMGTLGAALPQPTAKAKAAIEPVEE